jgi:GNAT superfamily N-acetyltransferase
MGAAGYVRAAVLSDAARIAALCERWRLDEAGYAEDFAGAQADQFSEQNVSAEIGMPPSGDGWLGWQVAVLEDRVAGAAAGGITLVGVGEVYHLVVVPECRRRGLGALLLEAVTDRQRTRSAAEQWISIADDDEAARLFCAAQGFTAVDEVRPRSGRLHLPRLRRWHRAL